MKARYLMMELGKESGSFRLQMETYIWEIGKTISITDMDCTFTTTGKGTKDNWSKE